MFVRTPRLRLRRFTSDDAGELHKLDNDPEVMRWINGGIETPYAVTRDKILPAFVERNASEPAQGYWAAELADVSTFVGWFSIRLQADEPGAVIGYRLKRAVWGRGLATEGGEALLDMGFAQMGRQQVTGSTYEHNVGSRRVMEKLGMHLARRFRLSEETLQAGETAHVDEVDVWDGDEVEYRINRETWLTRAPRAGLVRYDFGSAA